MKQFVYTAASTKGFQKAVKCIKKYLKDHPGGARPSTLCTKIARKRDRITEEDVRNAWISLLAQGKLGFTDDLKLSLASSGKIIPGMC